jgi:hypothetical protein
MIPQHFTGISNRFDAGLIKAGELSFRRARDRINPKGRAPGPAYFAG